MLRFDQAWSLYRAAEVRLPSPPPPCAPTPVAGLVDLLDRFDAFVLDAWGVLNLGSAPIPTARAAFAALRATGKPLVVVSNDGSSDPEQGAARHSGRGFAVAPHEIVYGVDLLPDALAARGLAPERCALVGDRRPPRVAAALGLGDLDQAPDPDAIVFLSTVGFDERERARVEALMSARPRPVLVGNPDIVSPEVDGIAIEPGYYAHDWAARFGAPVDFLGKPFAGVYTRALERLGHPEPRRVLCVGDSPHTDVLGGRAAGCATLLVRSGFLRGQNAERLCAESGLTPDFIAPAL
jgi:HAD superfamily hydrolase (TIGR01450 family)